MFRHKQVIFRFFRDIMRYSLFVYCTYTVVVCPFGVCERPLPDKTQDTDISAPGRDSNPQSQQASGRRLTS